MRAGWLAMVLALSAYGATPGKPFVDCSPEELGRAVPELAGMRFEASQDGLDELLGTAGIKLRSAFANFVDVSAAEEINELRFDPNLSATTRREVFRYAIRAEPAAAPGVFQEFRVDAATKTLVSDRASSDFLVLSYFYKLLDYLLPENQEQSRFRYLGRLDSTGQRLLVVAFAQQPGSRLESNIGIGRDGQTAAMQGLVWIDEASGGIVRLRVDLLGPVENFPFQTLTTDMSLAPVTFRSQDRAALLPSKIVTSATFAAGEFHSVHRYSDYESRTEKGASPRAAADAYESVAKGISQLQGSGAEDAIAAFREAIRLNPDLAAAHFYLANALLKAGDAAGAESESRQAVKLAPEFAVIHNMLGVLLGNRGDVAGAVAEFRTSVQLLPKEANVRFNLAQALERAGDRTAALAEYRTASELAPENADFKARYEQFGRTATAPALAETNIKVDVRQVLVPAIVTGKDRHYAVGLKREDFQVFEDGVEQKISAFSVEDAGLVADPIAAAPDSARNTGAGRAPSATGANPKSAPMRHTYLICIDSLHSSAANLMSFRQSLLKLFRSEQPGDARYILVALGTSVQILQDSTPDPEKIVQAIDSKKFQQIFLDSRKAAGNYDIGAFRRKLEEIRAACDHHDVMCSEKRSLDSEARQFVSEDQVYNKAYLTQFQALLEQLARAPGRRAIVLISDGFQLVPGKQALELLVAYFPEFRSASLEALERTQDLDPVLRAATSSNIPIYTIDSRGLYVSPYFDASNPGASGNVMPAVMAAVNRAASDADDTLREIAAATGGTAFLNSNDLLNGLRRAFADGRQYYMLSYVPTNAANDGKFRNISVKVRDNSMSVKAKRGYWAAAN